ncbi:MAG: sortase [Actinobacteria bacterium]|uniref:Unannotated protein n=1 Tax=freshwater metagenome TaxID=449393 RepID=A0A6J6Q6V2_9ZZZZ|nr:sortase [Actinomycetota bacterium]MSW76182.1 sortase [Actinomycetota bacterium]MSX56131.1 sortase [Actinomycetota bacterium]MSZ81892.1 sortase [Actinomycetota bacterium]MTB16731.1 sortase [Actinomycetota bacterium]
MLFCDGARIRRLSVELVVVGLVSVGLTMPAMPASVASAALPAGASKYQPLADIYRVADTRPGASQKQYTQIDAQTIEINIRAIPGVPATAIAVVVNLAIVDNAGSGYVLIYPAGEALPLASTANCNVAGCIVANMAHVKLGTAAGSEGKVRVKRSSGMNADFVVDVLGVYLPVDPTVAAGAVGGGRFVPLPSAQRVYETRPDYGGSGAFGAGETRLVALRGSNGTGSAVIPADALAVVVSVAAINGSAGYWTVFGSSQSVHPDASTLNLDRTGASTRAAQAIVRMDSDPSIKVFSQTGGNFIVDVVGYFTGASAAVSTDGLFVPGVPQRRLDTRNTQTLAPWNGSTFEFTVNAPSAASVAAAVVNLTATSPWDYGYLTAYAAGTAKPLTSNLNISAWPQTIANHAIVPVSNRGVAVYTFAGAHIIADVEGWYLGTPAAATLTKPANPSPAEVDAGWILAPQMNVSLPVAIGPDPEIIANSGTAASWTWKAAVSGTAHSMIFGHRTSHGGPFRYINSFAVGDVFFVRNVVGEWFRYRVMQVAVVRPKFSLLEAILAFLPTGTMQLIACSQANGAPGGVAYRFVVTARMIGVGQTPG